MPVFDPNYKNAGLSRLENLEAWAASFSGSGSLAPPNVVNPNGLRRWRAALGDALYGRATINVLGDSIAVGTGSDGSPTYSGASDSTYRSQGWVGQLRSLFAITYGDPGEGSIFAKDSGTRHTLTGGATFTSSCGPLEGGVTLNGVGHVDTVALPACTEIDIWTWNGSSSNASACSYNVDGAGAVNFTPGTGAAATDLTFKKTTITGLANTTHSLVLTGSVNPTFLACVVARKQTTGVQVNRYAVSGNTSANMVGQDSSLTGNANGQARMINASVKTPPADLVIIELAVNDFTNQNTLSTGLAQPGTIPSGLSANMQLVITAAVAAGACVLIVGEPRQNAVSYPNPMTYSEANYYAAAKSLANANDHVAFIDIGEIWGTNLSGQDLSLYNTSSVHPTRKGHGDIARILYGVLTRNHEVITPAA